jgi:SAM-dependent methyltransferase
MPDPMPELPSSPVPGLIPTLNNTGWMTESLDRLSQDFAAYAGGIAGESLDIGCAYGIATLAALEQGARVLAADLDARHLDILAGRTPPDQRGRLRTQVASLPEADFAPGSFGAILAARVLHFLPPAGVTLTLYKMFQWLEPGGRLYVVCDSPYVGPWRDAAPEYERRKSQGCPWPGLVIDYHRYLPEQARAASPTFIHPMDPDVLRRACEKLGFEVLEAAWLEGGTRFRSARDHAGIVARRPD